MKNKVFLPENVVKVLSSFDKKETISLISAVNNSDIRLPREFLNGLDKEARKMYDKKFKAKVAWDVFIDICVNLLRLLMMFK